MKFLIRFLCTALLGVGHAGAADLHQQRQQFLEARQALTTQSDDAYLRQEAALRDYVLYPYLRSAYLRARLDSVADGDIQEFLEQFPDTPISARLRSAWLHKLARERRWPAFLAADTGASSEASLRCYGVQARLASGERGDALLRDAEALWLVGHSQPDACDPVFDHLRSAGALNTALVWQRITLAMQQGELALVRHLEKSLPATERKWAKRWLELYQRPAQLLQHADYRTDIPVARDIVASGLQRLGSRDAAHAWQLWQQLKPRYSYTDAEEAALTRTLALAAARQRLSDAALWLDEVPADVVDSEVREWRVRTALPTRRWKALITHIDALPEEEVTEAWRYWKARAFEQEGDGPVALKLYRELAELRSYYGFMAADRIKQTYRMGDKPLQYTQEELDAVTQRLPVRRAGELYQLGLIDEARREWDSAVADFTAVEQQQAAVIAHRWGWHERAIPTVALAKSWDDLALRFPVLHQEEVRDSAKAQRLEAAWVYGVIRQESAFRTDARSSSGALGLMQLMPATAAFTARLFNLTGGGVHAVLNPVNNIRLGAAYLRHVLNTFDGSQLLATAAYNAGPGRIKQWLPAAAMPTDLWVETIPYKETRNYVQSVMAYSAIYESRLQQPVTRLRQRMGESVTVLAP